MGWDVADFGAAGNFGTKLEGFKNAFFDRDAVMKAVDKAARKQLSWFGGYCRRVVRNSLKEKGGTSAPGSPPFVHTTYWRKHTGRQRKLLAKKQLRLQFKDSILYAMDFKNLEVIIGPTLFNGSRSSPTVPELLEVGGSVAGNGQVVSITNNTVRASNGRFASGGRTRVRMKGALQYRARPYMHPGFEKSLQKLGERLKGCVTK